MNKKFKGFSEIFMKTKSGHLEYKLTGRELSYRAFDFNWDNINSFEDFKKTNLVLLSKNNLELTLSSHEKLQEWIDNNPDFEKYFMMIY